MKLAKSLQEIKASYIREILNAASAEGVISLAGGLPDDTSFPLDLMAKSLIDLPNRPELFQYGNTAGYTPLINHFRERYQLPLYHDSIVCTGSQQGLDLIARAFINPKDNIVLEAPSYLGAIQVFALAQANILSVSQGSDGPDLEQLESCFATNDIKLFYAVPDFHNPTGVCWSLNTRKKVSQLCCQYKVIFVEDVPYRELRFNGDALPLVSSFMPENSLILRSFSKIVTPGIRLGIVTGKSEWIDSLIKIKQAADLHSSIPMQAVLLDLLQHEKFDLHLEKLIKTYQQRYQVLMSNINNKLSTTCCAKGVDGGMFIWLLLPDCNIDLIAKSALEHGVAVVPSTVFYQNQKDAIPALRLNFTNATIENLGVAIDRLANVINAIDK